MFDRPMWPPGAELTAQEYDVFDEWIHEFNELNPDADLSMLELAELYAKYGDQ